MAKLKALQQTEPETDEQKMDRLLSPLVEQAQNGDRAALKTIKRVFGSPEVAQTGVLEKLYATLADPVNDVRRGYVMFGHSQRLLTQEGLLLQAKRIEQELAGPEPSYLERLLCERVATCWLALHSVEPLAALSTDKSTSAFLDPKVAALDKRYLLALVALARVRRLQTITPILAQVNISQGAAPRQIGARHETPGTQRRLSAPTEEER